MNRQTLRQKIRAISAFPESDHQVAAKLGDILENLNEWELFRINPIFFAEKYGFRKSVLTDLFVRGAKIGLFDFEWNLICPACGSIEQSHAAIREIGNDHFHCTLCDIDIPTELDGQIEVAFGLSSDISEFAANPYSSFDNYTRTFFSRNFSWSPEMTEYIRDKGIRSFAISESDKDIRIPFQAREGELFRLVSIEHHAGLELVFENAASATPQIVDADLLSNGFAPTRVSLPAGEVTIHVHNHLSSPAGLILMFVDQNRVCGILSENPPRMAPFLTGKMLLNNQTFRDLFKVQNLPYDFKLRMNNITILFTDLKGSTELYENTGDIPAYHLVQQHFELLKASARLYSGAIVKTMGDAIMASFSTPSDGVMAAADMVGKIRQLNHENRFDGLELGLKVGIHAGPALAVNANETPDYFGQTVNIAARVQGLAYSGEIWMTQTVYDADGVKDIIVASGLRGEKKTALLKGVRENTILYKCIPETRS